MPEKPKYFYSQSGAIPYLTDKNGKLRVVLITSRKRKRWIVPKGVIEADLSSADSAAKEAFEEAGVRGIIDKKSIGTYKYEKWGGVCRVEMYLLRVEKVFKSWPEDSERRREILSWKKAADKIDEPTLRQMLEHLPKLVARSEK